MTILRRIGSMTLIPGVPGKPATPGYTKLLEVPDPPAQTTLEFGGFGGYGVSIPVSTVFGRQGTTVIQSGGQGAAGGNAYPPRPGAEVVQSYNGTKGEYAVITSPDGTVKVVKL